MADKNFIGKTSSKQWPDGGETITINIGEDDVANLIAFSSYGEDIEFVPTAIQVKKSKSGKWYAEIVKPFAKKEPKEKKEDLPF